VETAVLLVARDSFKHSLQTFLVSIILPLKNSKNIAETASFTRVFAIDPRARRFMTKICLNIANAYLFGFAFQDT